MRALIQRVAKASVEVDKKKVSEINKGLLVFFGCHKDDSEDKIKPLAEKIVNLRIFPDQEDKMNLSLKDVSAEILIVSQFTLYANTQKGKRPSFADSLEPKQAKLFYDKFIIEVQKQIKIVKSGVFGSKMLVHLINDGPATFILDI